MGLLGLTTVALYLRLERKSSINKMVAELPPISQKWPNSPDGKSYADRLIKVEKISDSCLRFDGIGAQRPRHRPGPSGVSLSRHHITKKKSMTYTHHKSEPMAILQAENLMRKLSYQPTGDEQVDAAMPGYRAPTSLKG